MCVRERVSYFYTEVEWNACVCRRIFSAIKKMIKRICKNQVNPIHSVITIHVYGL